MDAKDLYRATVMLLSDHPNETVDAVFFHTRAHGDDDGLFELADWLQQNGRARNVAINGGDGRSVDPGSRPRSAWPGLNDYFRELTSLGVRARDIVITKPALHTKAENDAFLECARGQGWKSAVIIAQPHQLLRAFLGMVKSMADQDYWMRVYAASPTRTDWYKEVHGSQGKNFAGRSEQIDQEFIRLAPYTEGGSLATLGALFEYFRARKSIR